METYMPERHRAKPEELLEEKKEKDENEDEE